MCNRNCKNYDIFIKTFFTCHYIGWAATIFIVGYDLDMLAPNLVCSSQGSRTLANTSLLQTSQALQPQHCFCKFYPQGFLMYSEIRRVSKPQQQGAPRGTACRAEDLSGPSWWVGGWKEVPTAHLLLPGQQTPHSLRNHWHLTQSQAL